jgi:hypothetical protein
MKFVHGLMIALMLSMVAYVVNREMVRPDFQSAIRAKSGLSAGFVQAAYAEEAATTKRFGDGSGHVFGGGEGLV